LGGIPILIILGLLVLLALTTIYVGSRPRLPESLGPSRDNLVAFERDGRISVARVDGSGQRPISGDIVNAISPVFSPDGSKVAFVSAASSLERSGSLNVASVQSSGEPFEVGHGVNVVGTPGRQISWSPDGTQIAFAGAGVRSAIFVAQADGSGVKQITLDSMNRDLPSWSTSWDGERIAYRSQELDGQRVHLEYVRPDGSEVMEVTTMAAPDSTLSGLEWAPSNDVHTIQVSYVAGFGFGTPTRVMIDWLQTGTAGNATAAAWSDGVGGSAGLAPAWSPDGRWIAFITAGDGVVIAENKRPLATIYNSGAYDGQLRELGNVADCWIDWSPDGTALYGGSPDGCTGTVVVPVSDPDSAFVTYTPMSGVTSWQPLEP
jgi:hypothetical protein